MAIEIFPDIGEEIIARLEEINRIMEGFKKKLKEKDKIISDLESKLKEYQNGC